MATGGGPGDAEDYYDFDSRDLEHFSRYNQQFGPMLTWIFIKDKEVGGALTGLLFYLFFNLIFILFYNRISSISTKWWSRIRRSKNYLSRKT